MLQQLQKRPKQYCLAVISTNKHAQSPYYKSQPSDSSPERCHQPPSSSSSSPGHDVLLRLSHQGRAPCQPATRAEGSRAAKAPAHTCCVWPCSSSSTSLPQGLHLAQTTGDEISSSQACQRQLLQTKEALSGENAFSKPAMLQEQWL